MKLTGDEAIKFLTSIQGIGETTAKKLVATYGDLNRIMYECSMKNHKGMGIKENAARQIVRNFNALADSPGDDPSNTVQTVQVTRKAPDEVAASKADFEANVPLDERKGKPIPVEVVSTNPENPNVTTAADIGGLAHQQEGSTMMAVAAVSINPAEALRQGVPVQTMGIDDMPYNVGIYSGLIRKGTPVTLHPDVYKVLKKAKVVF